MNSLNDSGVVAGPAAGQRGHPHRLGGLAGTGLMAALAAMVATTVAAALPRRLASTSRSPMVAQRSRWPGSPW